MVLSFIGGDRDGAGNGTSAIFDWGAITGEADDDIALMFLDKESTAAYTATPANWLQVSGFPLDQDTGGFKFRTDLWWRRRAGDTSTATWSWTGSTWRYMEAYVYRGAYTGDSPPIPTLLGDEETNQNNQPVHPGIVVARANSGVVWAVYNFGDVDNTTAPSGFTHREGGSGVARNILVYDILTAATGATGTVTGNLSGDIEFPLTVLLELATEAAAAGGFTPRLALMGVG